MKEINFNKLDRDMKGIVVKDIDNKTYKYSELLYDDGLTGDLVEEFEDV